MSFNAKQFRHFSTSWQALREASVRSTTKIGRLSCRQGISKADSSYDLHKSAFPRISAKCFMQLFFHARSCADSVLMHLFLHIFFHATLVRASLFASLSVHSNTVSRQAHGACQTKQKHKNKICACFIRTSMCLLHMDWGITSFTHSNFQVKLQHPGTVTAFRLCYSILSSLVPCLASSLACSAGWSTPSCSNSCSTPSSQSRSLGRLVHCA